MINLLSTLEIKGNEVKNRIVMPPLASKGATAKGEVTNKLLSQYNNRQEVGIIISDRKSVV